MHVETFTDMTSPGKVYIVGIATQFVTTHFSNPQGFVMTGIDEGSCYDHYNPVDVRTGTIVSSSYHASL